MNKFTKLAALLFVALPAVNTLTSCSDDNEVTTEWWQNPTITNKWEANSNSAKLWTATNLYVNSVIYPTYSSLASYAEQLYNESVNMQTKFNAGTLTDADVEQVCETFKNARRQWERSESWLYGAASDFDIDPHIDTWPLDRSQMASFLSNSTMIAGLHSSDPIAFVNGHNGDFDSALGFHGIEFVLFRNGAARPASAFSKNEDDETFANVTVNCKEEVYFLVAVTGDLRDHCYQLEVSWLGEAAPQAHRDRVAELGVKTRALNNKGYYYGANLLLTGDGNSSYESMPEAVAEVFDGGMMNICQEVYSQKMGQAWRVANGQAQTDEEGNTDAGDYIESPYSKRSFIDYQDNIISIRNSLYGSLDGTVNVNSYFKFLSDNGYSKASELQSKLTAAIASLQTCIDSGIAFSDNPGHQQVKNAIDAVQALYDALSEAKAWIEVLH